MPLEVLELGQRGDDVVRCLDQAPDREVGDVDRAAAEPAERHGMGGRVGLVAQQEAVRERAVVLGSGLAERFAA